MEQLRQQAFPNFLRSVFATVTAAAAAKNPHKKITIPPVLYDQFMHEYMDPTDEHWTFVEEKALLSLSLSLFL
jgi:hypothetical protein